MPRWLLLLILIVLLLAAGGGAVVVVRKSAGAKEEARLSALLPQVRGALEGLRARLAAEGIRTFVGETVRDESEQAARVASGNSATNKSWHRLRRAVDLYPYDGAKVDLAGKRVDLFRRMHDVAKSFGFRGLAFNLDGTKRYITTKKGKVWDGGHLEFPEGMAWDVAAKKQKVIA